MYMVRHHAGPFLICQCSSYYICIYHLLQNPGGRPSRKDLSSLKLKNIDKKLAETIINEIVDSGPPVEFKDIGEYDKAVELDLVEHMDRVGKL